MVKHVKQLQRHHHNLMQYGFRRMLIESDITRFKIRIPSEITCRINILSNLGTYTTLGKLTSKCYNDPENPCGKYDYIFNMIFAKKIKEDALSHFSIKLKEDACLLAIVCAVYK